MGKQIILLIILVMSSCSLFKRNTKSTDESFNARNSIKDSNTTTSFSRKNEGKQILFRRDSSDANYKIHFWPKGTFRFSPDGVFSGEFDSILMEGKQNQLIHSAGVLNSRELEHGKSSEIFHQKDQMEAGGKKVMKTKIPDLKVSAILFCLVIVSIYLGFRWFFSSKK
ncbi:hypothetical protein [Pedobacter hartonius]|uniref:Lipoprotein n=1 Tax=Pedobacter hartonius TaxID=425514 RepID=A0A1H3W1N3_9SPHI|nr:hypothetical protein [Pedobacter hartonius]SDZ80976.1 hypothetical protein SAMN05443550_10159 [Pedobacter hartonius]